MLFSIYPAMLQKNKIIPMKKVKLFSCSLAFDIKRKKLLHHKQRELQMHHLYNIMQV